MGPARLAIEHTCGRSVVTSLRATSPLRLLAAAGGGHAAWVYQSSLGGGFVGADSIALGVAVGRGAALFLGTQAAGKVYRGTRASWTLEATVGDGATLVAWPDPVACFAGATFDQAQHFALAGTASLIAVDAWTAGRVARGERWQLARAAARTTVAIGGARVLDDGFVLANAHGELAARLPGIAALATVVVAGPGFAHGAIAAAIAARPIHDRPWVVASAWPWGAVIRIAAPDTETLARSVRALVGDAVRDALGADPWTRKW